MRFEFLFLFSIFLTFSAFADEGPIASCDLKKYLVLTAPTDIICQKDMHVEDGVHLITHGYPFRLTVIGEIFFGAPPSNKRGTPPPADPGLQILANSPRAKLVAAPGPIMIYAGVVHGFLKIVNTGPVEKDASVSLEFYKVAPGFAQEIAVPPRTQVDVIVNGSRAKVYLPDYSLKPSSSNR